jgi:hypothetical protein
MVLNVEFRQVIISHLHLFSFPSFSLPSVATQRKTNAKRHANEDKRHMSLILFVIDKKLDYDLAVLEAGAG